MALFGSGNFEKVFHRQYFPCCCNLCGIKTRQYSTVWVLRLYWCLFYTHAVHVVQTSAEINNTYTKVDLIMMTGDDCFSPTTNYFLDMSCILFILQSPSPFWPNGFQLKKWVQGEIKYCFCHGASRAELWLFNADLQNMLLLLCNIWKMPDTMLISGLHE